MDDWLMTYEVEIDAQEITKLKYLAHQKMRMREDKFETSITKFLMQIILREIRLFSAFAILLTVVLLVVAHQVGKPYVWVVCQSTLLGAAALLEIFRMYRYRMSEVQFPTKMGMGRMFLYKIIALSVMEYTCMITLMVVVSTSYVVDGYVLIAYSILPNLLVCGGLLGASMFFHSLFVMMGVYALSMLTITLILQQLIEQLERFVMHGVILALSIIAVCLFLWMIKRLFTYMKEAGGQLVWN